MEALPFTQQVINEALRLYPPGWLLSRRTIEPDVLSGFEIPAGAKKSGENLLANESQHARAHDCDTDYAGRAGAYSLGLRLRHRRTKNNVSAFPKAKISAALPRVDVPAIELDQSVRPPRLCESITMANRN